MKSSTQSLIKKADKLFSTLIYKRKSCQRCGSEKALECAHIEVRGKKGLRWCEDNALLLCHSCHKWWHHKPIESREWFDTYFPIQSQFLYRERNRLETNLGSTIEFTIKSLKERLANYE